MPTSTRMTSPSPAHAGGGRRAAWRALLVFALAAPGTTLAQSGDGWERIGEMGMMQLVIVDHERVAEEALYDDAIATICRPATTCFLRFYSNPQGVPVTVPLPDEIADNSTAFYTLSTKHSKQIFRWSCRIVNEPDNCY